MTRTLSSGGPAALCALVLALLVSGVHGVWDLQAIDRAITDQVPGLRGPALTNIMLFISALGDSTYLKFMGPLIVISLLLRRDIWRAAGCAGAFLLMPFIVRAIKGWVARPRPTADLYGGVEVYSFPSGHAANSALIYGALALLAFLSLKGRTRWAAVTGLTLLVLLIAASRIYVGAHWPSDTVAGLALGGLMLTGLALVLQHPRHPPATPHTPLFALTGFALTAPVYAALSLPAAHILYRALG